ncbi:MAG: hypothetical protein GEU92_08655 [Alphaproteobacteria bacterium]|nr:hypothetical protein [Alphaproteobacteria bacterium]
MDNQTASKMAVLEELVATLYANKFDQFSDPLSAVAEYAEHVQTKLEQTKLPDVPESVGMELEAEFARFWRRVAHKLRQSDAGPVAE